MLDYLASNSQEPGWFASLHQSFLSVLNDPVTIFLAGLALLLLFVWYIAADLDRIKKLSGTFLILGFCGFSLFSLIGKGINFGIDIKGGVSYLMTVKPNVVDGVAQPISRESMEQAKAMIERRIDSTGAREASVVIQGSDRLLIQMPITDPKEIEELQGKLTQIAKLEIMPVHPDNSRLVAEGVRVVPGYRLFDLVQADREGHEHTEKLFLNTREVITGKEVAQAMVDNSRNGVIQVELSRKGKDMMERITSQMTKGKDRLAVVLDGRCLIAPTVNATLGKSFIIEGLNSPGEPTRICQALNNPLENPLQVDDARQISASLGEAALTQGEIAGVTGLILTFIMVLVYYRFAGFVAIFGLIINAVILLGAMSLFDFTLTLPGIAGIILSIGVSVDANVLIYERLREEIAAGRSLGMAIRNSFDKAFSAIFDSNLTSLITAVVLFWFASGSIRGFAITVAVGIVSSMLGAIVVTRVLFYWAESFGVLKKLTFMNLFKASNYDFLGKRKLCAVISGVALLGLAGFTAYRGADCLGIDFTGGTVITYNDVDSDNGKVTTQSLEEALKPLGLSQMPVVQEMPTATGSTMTIRCASSDLDVNKIQATVRNEFPTMKDIQPSKEMIGPSLGKEFMRSSLIALALGMVAIMIYLTVRFEFAFALGAVVALFHDVLIVLGLIIISGQELQIIHVGALLTIAGYSINDTIVIFDRIRETLRFADPNETVSELMNKAVNDTLPRTLLTSVTTFVSVLCLWFMGGPAMKGFSFAILVGILIGTYSSIFIAAPVVLMASRRTNLREDVMHGIRAGQGEGGGEVTES